MHFEKSILFLYIFKSIIFVKENMSNFNDINNKLVTTNMLKKQIEIETNKIKN